MNINQQPHNKQTSIAQIITGGTFYWGMMCRTYRNYKVLPPLGENVYEPSRAKSYYDAAIEFLNTVAKDNVIDIAVEYCMKRFARKTIFGKWIVPEYVEDGEVNKFKNRLKDGKYGAPLWCDYMWYMEEMQKSPITNLMTSERSYVRDIHILLEKPDMPLLDDAIRSSNENYASAGIFVYPHSKIKHLEDDKATMREYIHCDDYIIYMAISDRWSMLHFEPNPKYFTYHQFMDLLSPILEKHGIILKSKDNPYIDHGFPADGNEYYPHTCAGYTFFD